MISKPFSPNPGIQTTIDRLLAIECPPLPVAPAQDADLYPARDKSGKIKTGKAGNQIPAFTGKNPSYLDSKGIPHLINHQKYQSKLPTESELQGWFGNPANGIGTLGGHAGITWIDFDAKHFDSQEDCDRSVTELIQKHNLGASWIERTGSGGWRIAVIPKVPPTFTNFALAQGGTHVGEALHSGRFTVLAPTIHPNGTPYELLASGNPVKVESLESIGIFPHSKSKTPSERRERPKRQESPVGATIKLEDLGNPASREILQGRYSSDDRSTALTAAINEWFGWQNFCDANRIPYSGTAEGLARDAGTALGLDSDRVVRIVRSIDSATCNPAALTMGGEVSCWLKIWRLDRKTYDQVCPDEIKTAVKAKLEANKTQSGKVVSIHTGVPIVPIDSLDVEIRKVLDLNLTGARLQAEKIKLRQSSALTDREFAQLWEVVEQDYEIGSESNPDEIRRLLKAKRSSLALADIVPGAIAAPLARLAQMMNLREEVYLVSLLTTIGSLAQNGTTLLLHKGLGFEVAPNLYSAVVAVASQRKSPVISQIATKPLKILEKEAKQAYKRALEAWQERKAEAKANEETFNELEPSPEIYFFTKASGEAILQQANRCRNRGLLNLSDELAGVFKSKNQYRGGRGSDGEDMLSYYDAAGGKTLRVDGVRNDVDSLNYGILGGIQPRVLADFLGNCEDSNGNWARFIFVNQPIAAATWPEGDFDNWEITTMLADYYRAIAWFDPAQYRLSQEAEARFGQLYNELEQRRVSESNPALQAVIGKSAGRIGKVALGLHLLESAAAGMAVPSLEISVATVNKAAIVAELAIEQIRAIYTDCDTENQQNPVMAKIIELSQRKGEVSARDVYQSLPSKGDRPNTAKIRQLFAELANQGFGEVVGEGKSIQFNAYQEQIKTVEVEPEPEPIEPEIQPGDYVVLASDGYQGLEPGQQMLIVRLAESEGRLFALAMDDEGTNHSIWLCHLQIYKSTIEQEAS